MLTYYTNMKISSLSTNFNQSFGAATININALSDTHGELSHANCALEEMRNQQDDVFCKQEKGKRNVLAICGDWYMDCGKTGYKSNPTKPLGFFQNDMLNAFINGVKGMAEDTMSLFTPGNHEFDGGVPLLDEILSGLDAKVLMTNLDIANSDGLEKTRGKNKLTNQVILEIEDDKNPNLTHKVMFLGVSPVNLLYYQKNLSGVKLTDNILKAQAKVDENDYQDTLDECKLNISQFKKENPNGIVVLMSHTGVNFADTLAKEAPVDLAFDGHEHKDRTRHVKGTPIVPLSMNFKKIVNAKIEIDDNGKLKEITLKEINPDKANKDGALSDFYNYMFKEDMKETYSIKSANPSVSCLDIEGIREGNSYLANFVTDSVLEELQKKDATIDFFALNSSAIRHPLKLDDKPCVSPFDVMNVLVGIKEEDGKIMVSDVKGEDIVYMVLDNILFNKDMPKKNPLVHYSGLAINKTKMLEAYNNGEDLKSLSDYVLDMRTQKPVEMDRMYRIANVEKYFNKSQNMQIKTIKNTSTYTGDTVQELFKQHFENSEGSLEAKCDTRIV